MGEPEDRRRQATGRQRARPQQEVVLQVVAGAVRVRQQLRQLRQATVGPARRLFWDDHCPVYGQSHHDCGLGALVQHGELNCWRQEQQPGSAP